MKPKSRSSPRKIERVCGQVGVARLRREKGPRLEPRGWRRSGRADEDRGLVALKADLLGEQRRDLGQFGRRLGSTGRLGSDYRRQPDQRIPRHKARRGADGEDRWWVDRQHQFHHGICRQRQWASRLSRVQRCSADLLESRSSAVRPVRGQGQHRPSGQKPRRSRANLRPRSRPASVIDRLLKNQNPLENRNNLRSSSPHPGLGQTSGEPRRNFAVRNPSTREPWLFRTSVFGSGIRRIDGEAVGGRRLARTPPKRVTRWLATSIIAPPAAALSSAGDELPSPITLF